MATQQTIANDSSVRASLYRKFLRTAERANFAGHFDHDRVALEQTRNRALGLRRFSREHDFEARRFAILEHANVNADNVWNRHQLFVMIGEHGIDVSLRRR
jgi:hypothetical protein